MIVIEDKLLERLDFEKKWLIDMLRKNELYEVDIEIAFATIKAMLRGKYNKVDELKIEEQKVKWVDALKEQGNEVLDSK